MAPPLRSSPSGAADPEAEADALAFLAANRGRPAIQPPPRAAAYVPQTVSAKVKAGAPGLSALKRHWEEIVGPALAALCAPEKLTPGKTGGTLTVRAGGAAALLLQAQSSEIVARVNQFAGGATVARIAIQQRALAPPRGRPSPPLSAAQAQALEADLARIATPELRDALRRLGAAVLAGPRR
jgi:hypothetical protein